MDRDSKKRSRESVSSTTTTNQHPTKKREVGIGDTATSRELMMAERPHGVFEFPWKAAAYWEGYDIRDRDVFFSSLVDGCSAAIGLPGDRLFLAPATIVIADADGGSWAPDGGVDGIWSCALSQPLTALERYRA